MADNVESDHTPPNYNPFLRETRINPYPIYRRLRRDDPIHMNRQAGIWFLTRHADCLAVLRDTSFSAELAQDLRQRDKAIPRSMLNSDPPEHTRLRKAVGNVFSASTVERWRPTVRAMVSDLLQQLPVQGEADLIGSFAAPLAGEVFGELLDIPCKDRARFQEWANAAAVNLDPLASPLVIRYSQKATDALEAFLTTMIKERRGSAADNFFTHLLRTVDEHDILTDDEIVTVYNLLVIGGYEPLVNLVGNGMLALLRNTDELWRLRDEPTLIKTAVDELLRYDSPIQVAARVAINDVPFDRKTIKEGQAVVLLLGAANRDPAVFADPERLDIARSPNPHLSFGGGVHYCLGASLVRLVTEVSIDMLVQRSPHMRLATQNLAWHNSLVPRGLKRLPVVL